jgi:hypothetical protein
VLGFIGKPFKQERLAQAINKVELGSKIPSQQLKYLSIYLSIYQKIWLH